MGIVFTLDYDGDMYLNGRMVLPWDVWDVPEWNWTYEYDWFGTVHEGDEDPVYPTYHEQKNKRIEYTGRCSCEHCQRYYHHTDHGFRQRGPAQVWEMHGHRRESYGPCRARLVGAFNCWKQHRHYQAHGRVRIPKRVDPVDLLHGMYPLR